MIGSLIIGIPSRGIMSNAKRPRQGGEKSKKRYRSDGTPIWGKRSVDGPGIWVSCVKGKEKQTVGELYDLFEGLASELWPETAAVEGNDEGHGDSDDGAVEEDLEKQIAKELASMKRSRKEQRFERSAFFFPFDRYAHRLTPVSSTCVANSLEIKSLAHRVLKPFLAQHPDSDFRVRRPIDQTCPEIPVDSFCGGCAGTNQHEPVFPVQRTQKSTRSNSNGWSVDLEHAEVFILVEVFKSVCGISVVKDYYAHQRFNVMETANIKNLETKLGEEGRVTARESASGD
ncbi:hypothetical protein BJV74DRAFT_842264 [Russula compacta]|nr:hypothetical protein BJV74DRAFT_842264 [Russula compacta]